MPNNQISFKIGRKLTEEESAALAVAKKLQDSGFETYWAGGAVRDELLGLEAHEVHDIDIATVAKPEEIKKIFPDSYDRGKAFGVVAARYGEFEFEITTFRKDIGIFDHRRPEKIEFSSAKLDAGRRDFTINGLFYDPVKAEIIDFVGGIKDLKTKTIRFIGEPAERIKEDYLRMLRAARFSCKLNFAIEKISAEEIKKNAPEIGQISAERLREELGKILLCRRRDEGILALDRLGLLKELLPEVVALKNISQPKEFHSEGDVFTHTLLALKNIGATDNEPLVWAVLLHDIAKPATIGYRSKIGKTSITFFEHDAESVKMATEILGRLKFSHHFINATTWAIGQHMRIVNAFRGMSQRKQEKLFSDPNIQLLLDLTKADLSASLRPDGKTEMKLYEDAVNLKEKFEREASIEEKEQAKKFSLVTGYDIMKILKIPAGPKIGQIKSQIEQQYLDGKINTRQEALKSLEKY